MQQFFSVFDASLFAVDGNYTNWSPWSSCSVTCSNGTRIRNRECNNPPPKYGGEDCHVFGEAEEIEACFNEQDCPGRSLFVGPFLMGVNFWRMHLSDHIFTSLYIISCDDLV